MTARAKRLNRKSEVRRRRDPIPWKYCLLTLVCGLFLVAGFFYAARQHFASMQYSMENANLRKQIKELESESNRYKLAREIALTPGEIKKAATKLGLRSMTARNIKIASPTNENDDVRSGNNDSDKNIDLKEPKTETPDKETKEKEKVTESISKTGEKLKKKNKTSDEKTKGDSKSQNKIENKKPGNEIARK